MSLPQGSTAKEEKEKAERIFLEKSLEEVPIGIKTPLEIGTSSLESLFKMNYKINDQILDNLKNLLMTKKGERLGFNDYGTDLWKVYNSNFSKEEIYEYAMSEIQKAVKTYMPSIELENFYSKKLDSFEKKDILENPGEYYKTEAAKKLYSGQNSINVMPSKISLNSDDPEMDELYKLTVEYRAPSISTSDTYTVNIYLRTSK